jgi:hypothetical protein
MYIKDLKYNKDLKLLLLIIKKKVNYKADFYDFEI